MSSNFYEILNATCKDHGETVTEITQKLGLSKGNVTGWKNGASPNSDIVVKFSKYLKVSTDYLLGIETKQVFLTKEERQLIKLFRKSNLELQNIILYLLNKGQILAPSIEQNFEETDDPTYSIKIPILGRAAAGSPIEMIDDFDYILVHDRKVTELDFAVIASGDSMIEEKIFDGDIVIVHRQIEIEHQGQLSLVAVGDCSTIKRFFITEDGYMLRPANPKYEKQFYSRDADVRILGKVIKVINKSVKD